MLASSTFIPVTNPTAPQPDYKTQIKHLEDELTDLATLFKTDSLAPDFQFNVPSVNTEEILRP